MKPLLLLLAVVTLTTAAVSAQVSPTTEAQPIVTLVKLSPLTYPPLARMARITGDVKLEVHVRADGTVDSVELLSGHPMLAPAAVENAKKSQFECKDCTGETSYELTYTFGLITDFTKYDKVEDRPARTPKCLYLWKCGVVQVHSFDLCTTELGPEISQSPGHVTILAFPVCVNVMSSTLASR